MRLGHIELFVRDPSVSLEFYRDVLGFEVAAVQGGGKFVWLRCGRFKILLRPGQGPLPDLQKYADTAAGIVLYTDDLRGTVATRKRRGLAFRGTDGCDTCPTFTDPDGHWYQLVDPAQQE